jgi:glycerol-3-phosphate dehydrogenase
MPRNLSILAHREYDVVIVGGGIFGVCAAWDAALRGLSVALVERGDIAHATSASCFKMVHGGIRYLQHADLPRLRESSRERGILLRIAPHLVRPLPIVVPTYGHGVQGKALLRAGLAVYDLLTIDRHLGVRDPARRVPAGRVLSREECLSLFPWVETRGLTGAGLFYDGHMPSPARLAFAVARSAMAAGAVVVNYVEALDLVCRRGRVHGVRARDVLSGDEVEIRGRIVLNAAGPWAERLLDRWLGRSAILGLTFSRDAYVVVPRRLTGEHAVALAAQTRDPDALLSRGPRHLFLVPWRDSTLVGVWHVVSRAAPDEVEVTEADLATFLEEVNARLPFDLTLGDVSMWHAGLVLFGENGPAARHLRYGKRSQLVDHAARDGVDGLVSMVGVRYTTARAVAEKAVDLVFAKLGHRPPAPRTAVTPVHGGRIDRYDAFVRDAVARRPQGLRPAHIAALVESHGSAYEEVLRYAVSDPALAEPLDGWTILKAQVLQAVRDEMAVRLADVVLRRTDLGTSRHPGEQVVRTCADIMAAELEWSADRRAREIADVMGTLGRRQPAGSLAWR